MIDESAARKHISAMEHAPYIAVDTETTGFNVKDGRDYLMGISVAYILGDLGLVSAYFPFRHQDENLPQEFLFALQRVLEEKPLVFHNLKFDLHSLRTIGIYPRGRCFDTLMIQHMLNEEFPSKSLDYLSKLHLKDQKTKDQVKAWAEAFGWATVPAAMMAEYAKHDAELTFRLFELLWPKMKNEELHTLWPRELDYTRSLQKMEALGVKVNVGFCESKIDIGNQRMEAITDYLGFTPTKPTELAPFLFDDLKLECKFFTDTGKPCLDKKAMEYYDEVLEKMDDTTAKMVLEYRGWQKAISALYHSALSHMSPDGRVRTNFKQHGTKTGRLSSSEPNLQQIPRNSAKEWNGDAKKAFCAEDGYELWEFDYSQLEYRLAAVYGNEPVLLDIFANGEDPFLPTAIEVFGGVEHRQSAKTLTYTTLYGGGIARLVEALGLTPDTAAAVRQKFRDLYPGIYAASATASKLAAERGWVRYWTGRRRHFPNRDAAHKAFNSVIQGGAAELVKDALLRVDAGICSEAVRLVLTVHDSLVLEIRTDLVDDTIPNVIKLMTDFPQINVKLDVDAHRWGA